jgi:hypothetical protein
MRIKPYEFKEGDKVPPFGRVIQIWDIGEKYSVIEFDGRVQMRELKTNRNWYVQRAENVGEIEMVSHRRRPSDTDPGLPSEELPMQAYVQEYAERVRAADKALADARLIAHDPDQATLFLHESTVQAQLAQAAATMATAVPRVEIRAVTE